jgi:hypothetical protein
MRLHRHLLPFAAACLLAAPPLQAQETQVAPEGHVPPPASVAQMDWLVGRWEGTGIDGHRAVESWLAPFDETMVGTFVQADASGGIMFSEHMYLMPDEGSLALKLKHFNPDLTGWEDAAGMQRFRLLSVEPCRALFSGLTIRCDGEGGLLIAVRMRAGDGSTSELVFRFTRAG